MLGAPVAHSLSPALHRAAYASLGLDWRYDPVEVRADDLAAWLDGRGPEWAGVSLTMPLKQTVLPLLDAVSPMAVATGAANTVLLSGTRSGDNTDVAGLVEALREAGVREVDRSVVLGGGATAASALAALAVLGDREPLVLAREPARCGPLRAAAERLGSAPRVRRLDEDGVVEDRAAVVINTTPPGALDGSAERLAGSSAVSAVLLDVVYAPWPTALARAWRGPVVGGATMLLHQAARQVELMTGLAAPVEVMRRALDPALLAEPELSGTELSGPERAESTASSAKTDRSI